MLGQVRARLCLNSRVELLLGVLRVGSSTKTRFDATLYYEVQRTGSPSPGNYKSDANTRHTVRGMEPSQVWEDPSAILGPINSIIYPSHTLRLAPWLTHRNRSKTTKFRRKTWKIWRKYEESEFHQICSTARKPPCSTTRYTPWPRGRSQASRSSVRQRIRPNQGVDIIRCG